MNRDKLKIDMKADPGLADCSFKDVDELRGYLLEVHKYLVDPNRSGAMGYLYRQQILRNREGVQNERGE